MAVKLQDVGGIPNFECHGDQSQISQKWKRWKRAFELFLTSKGITEKKQKRALLLHTAGMDVQDIFDTLTDTGNEDDYDIALSKLDEYFHPRENVPFERHQFRQMRQEKGETVDQYITRLRKKAETCEFTELEENIRDQVIDKCESSYLRKKFLEKGGKLTLKQLQEIARAVEQANRQAASIENRETSQNGTVHQVQRKTGGLNRNTSCYRCGNRGHFARDQICPARNARCNKCKNIGHYEKMCKTKMEKNEKSGISQAGAPRLRGRGFQGRSRGRGGGSRGRSRGHVHYTEEEEVEEEEYAFGINTESECQIGINVGGCEVTMHIDSGASCNVIDENLWEKLKGQNIKCKSEKANKVLYSYASDLPLELLGKFSTSASVAGKSVQAEFVVVKGKGVPLLGRKTATELGVLKLGPQVNVPVHSIEEFSDLFNGVGKLKGHKVKLHIDENVTPVAQSVRRIPFSLRKKVEEKLGESKSMDIIEEVDGPTSWVSPVVVVPKPSGEIRLCVDMRQANLAIIRERHPIPTIDEILQEMNESKVFSKIDLRWGYHQLELDEDSRGITTFVTHAGLFRYKRLMFGINAAPEIYQHTIRQILQGCEGAINISDDIIIHAATTEEHQKRLKAVLQRLSEKGLTLYKEKCCFGMAKLEFMGHVLSDKGIGPTDEKVKAVLNAREPENASEVRSFLGLVTYSARFIENLATTAEPLRKLTRKDATFSWGKEQKHAFETLKKKLADATVLAYFNSNAKTQLIVDASPVGLGAVLTQIQNGETRAVCYASRALSDVEKRYSQTEKEALAIVWACERFHLYLFGIDFELITDHKPLEVIYSSKSKPSARIQRWVLRLQPYSFKVKYKPGKYNIADALSRLTQTIEDVKGNVGEEYIRFVAKNAAPVAVSIQEIERESCVDDELVQIRDCIRTDNWSVCELPAYKMVKNELAVVGQLVVRGTRLVIPNRLRKHILDLAHEGHQGITKTKQRLRSKVWWPGIDREAEHVCRKCHACQVVSTPSPPEPISRTRLPDRPWQDLAIDLMGPFPSGESVLVVVDYYSRYFEIVIMKDTSSDKIVLALEQIFATHGLPFSITSDNGPQFISQYFEKYLAENNIEHIKSTPLWPQANGEVERQNRTLLKAIRAAAVEGKDWKKEILKFLVAYRNTPHSTTGVSPAELLFGRKIRTKLPELDLTMDKCLEEIRECDQRRKEKGKNYADQSRNAQKSDILVGDQVLLQKRHENKLSTKFEYDPYEVVDKSGSEVTVMRDGVKYKRNVAHMKKFVGETDKSLELEPCVSNDNEVLVELDDSGEISQNDEMVQVSESTVVQRPTRTRLIPTKFKDFELY